MTVVISAPIKSYAQNTDFFKDLVNFGFIICEHGLFIYIKAIG
jgi:hypothetical protein